ncbi:hypothetical protein HY988_01785 [Candidatus Micrarchaeota archaeon]|nr:hypothetical protein [Candidatus Micrarchaeota archaeon]
MAVSGSVISHAADSQIIASLNVTAVAELGITSINISNGEFFQRSGQEFTVGIKNSGNTVGFGNITIEIFGKDNNLADTISFVEVALAPGEAQTVTHSWSPNVIPPGEYLAVASLNLENNENNQNNNQNNNQDKKNISFLVIEAPKLPNGDRNPATINKDGKNTGTEVFSNPPETSVPAVVALPQLRIIRQPVFQEMASGTSTVIFPLIENPSAEIAQVNVTSGNSGAALVDDIGSVSIPSKEKISVAVPLRVPKEIPSGYYLTQLEYTTKQNNITYPTIIKVVNSKSERHANAYRAVSFDHQANATLVTIVMKNPGNETIKHVQLYEKVPKTLSGSAKNLNFITTPSEIINDDPEIRWDFENIFPGETRNIVYSIPGIHNDLEQYANWPIDQIVTIEPYYAKNLLLNVINAPAMQGGQKKNITIALFNSGATNQAVDLEVLGPSGWEIGPKTASTYLESRKSREVNFELLAPENAAPGAYTFTIKMGYGGSSDEKTISLIIEKPAATPQSIPPLREQLLGYIQRNITQIILGAALTLMIVVVLYFLYKTVSASAGKKPKA